MGVRRLKVGDRCTVRNHTASGKPMTEGVAELIRFVRSGPEYDRNVEVWMVQFPGEDEPYERRVLRTDRVKEG